MSVLDVAARRQVLHSGSAVLCSRAPSRMHMHPVDSTGLLHGAALPDSWLPNIQDSGVV